MNCTLHEPLVRKYKILLSELCCPILSSCHFFFINVRNINNVNLPFTSVPFQYIFYNINSVRSEVRWTYQACRFYPKLRIFALFMQVSINFIQNHPPGTNPRDTTLKKQKPSTRDNHCVQNPSPQDKTGNQKPHPWDIKLENFTNVSINSDNIRNEKLCGLNN